jgi:hypothetical protein
VVEAILELLEAYLKIIYFQLDDKLFQQKVVMAMGRCLSMFISNNFMENFENWLLT